MDNCHSIRILTDVIPSPKIKGIGKEVANWNGREVSIDRERWSMKNEPSATDELLYRLLVRTLLRPTYFKDCNP